MKIYGIKNCDKIKKTILWCAQNQRKCFFHDYRVDGIDHQLVTHFLSQHKIEDIINKRSTTWRKLSDQEKSHLTLDLVINNPTLLKRPIIELNEKILIGYFPETWL